MKSNPFRHTTGVPGSIESWLVSAGRDRRPGSPLNVPPYPASNFVLGDCRAYARDDATPGWDALEEIVGGLEGLAPRGLMRRMARQAGITRQRDIRMAREALRQDHCVVLCALQSQGQLLAPRAARNVSSVPGVAPVSSRACRIDVHRFPSRTVTTPPSRRTTDGPRGRPPFGRPDADASATTSPA